MGKREKRRKRNPREAGAGIRKHTEKMLKKDEKRAERSARKYGVDSDEDEIMALLDAEMSSAPITQSVVASAEAPSPRVHAVFVANPAAPKTEILLFGGECFKGKRVTVFNDLLKFNIPHRTWSVIRTSNRPLPRSAAASLTLRQAVVIFGGEYEAKGGTAFHHYNDWWRLDTTDYTWQKLFVKNGPSGRSGHRMALWHGRDVQSSFLAAPTTVATSRGGDHGITPDDATAADSESAAVVFGGFTDDLKTTRYFNDLWVVFGIDTDHPVPRQLVFPNRDGPCGRSACALAVAGRTVVVYGGYVAGLADPNSITSFTGRALSDMWVTDLVTPLWRRVKKAGVPPALGRCSFATCRDDLYDRLILFGGVVDGADDSATKTKTVGGVDERLSATYFDDIHALVLGGGGHVGKAKDDDGDAGGGVLSWQRLTERVAPAAAGAGGPKRRRRRAKGAAADEDDDSSSSSSSSSSDSDGDGRAPKKGKRKLPKAKGRKGAAVSDSDSSSSSDSERDRKPTKRTAAPAVAAKSAAPAPAVAAPEAATAPASDAHDDDGDEALPTAPAPRMNAMCAFVNGHVVLYGGFHEKGYVGRARQVRFGDVWRTPLQRGRMRGRWELLQLAPEDNEWETDSDASDASDAPQAAPAAAKGKGKVAAASSDDDSDDDSEGGGGGRGKKKVKAKPKVKLSKKARERAAAKEALAATTAALMMGGMSAFEMALAAVEEPLPAPVAEQAAAADGDGKKPKKAKKVKVVADGAVDGETAADGADGAEAKPRKAKKPKAEGEADAAAGADGEAVAHADGDASDGSSESESESESDSESSAAPSEADDVPFHELVGEVEKENEAAAAEMPPAGDDGADDDDDDDEADGAHVAGAEIPAAGGDEGAAAVPAE